MAKSLTNYFIFTQKRRFDSRSWRFSRQNRRYFSRFSGEQSEKHPQRGKARVLSFTPARALSFQSYEKHQKNKSFSAGYGLKLGKTAGWLSFYFNFAFFLPDKLCFLKAGVNLQILHTETRKLETFELCCLQYFQISKTNFLKKCRIFSTGALDQLNLVDYAWSTKTRKSWIDLSFTNI